MASFVVFFDFLLLFQVKIFDFSDLHVVVFLFFWLLLSDCRSSKAYLICFWSFSLVFVGKTVNASLSGCSGKQNSGKALVS